MKITKADIAILGTMVGGVPLVYTKIPIVQRVGGFLFTGAFIIGMYRIYRKAKAEKKEVFFL
ncbi:MAG: hypothetical protein JSV12_02185 [Candidatus Bathyarchaeota archaeon]|nr:MAG: hypothetical protein JSV12_02185 [Candidatus Bathyarchaeota archaeon]